jgi:hypothetical protein
LSENEELELEALQRKLDDAFETTRPRRGFEDELWLRVQARRPFWARLREAFVALSGRLVAAPAVPLAAVAVLLVVIVGVGVLGSSGLHFGIGKQSSGTAPNAALAPGAAFGQFGRVPTPVLRPGQADQTNPSQGMLAPNTSAGESAATLYFGPATLTWTGSLPGALAQAPVYRYTQPTPAQNDQLAATLGAVPDTHAASGPNRQSYVAQSLALTIYAGSAQPSLEPRFDLTDRAVVLPSSPPVPSQPSAALAGSQAVAGAFLGLLGLTASWPDVVVAQAFGDVTKVEFLRVFPLQGGGTPFLVNGIGERYGIEVDLLQGQAAQAFGVLPIDLQSADYRLISNDTAVRLALASPAAAAPATDFPVPVVRLDTVQLVYTLAVSGDFGYYEPAYLFSGTFQNNGQTYTKRVLVPLVEPSTRSS